MLNFFLFCTFVSSKKRAQNMFAHWEDQGIFQPFIAQEMVETRKPTWWMDFQAPLLSPLSMLHEFSRCTESRNRKGKTTSFGILVTIEGLREMALARTGVDQKSCCFFLNVVKIKGFI